VFFEFFNRPGEVRSSNFQRLNDNILHFNLSAVNVVVVVVNVNVIVAVVVVIVVVIVDAWSPKNDRFPGKYVTYESDFHKTCFVENRLEI
jgi:hypothetical protein